MCLSHNLESLIFAPAVKGSKSEWETVREATRSTQVDRDWNLQGVFCVVSKERLPGRLYPQEAWISHSEGNVKPSSTIHARGQAQRDVVGGIPMSGSL